MSIIVHYLHLTRYKISKPENNVYTWWKKVCNVPNLYGWLNLLKFIEIYYVSDVYRGTYYKMQYNHDLQINYLLNTIMRFFDAKYCNNEQIPPGGTVSSYRPDSKVIRIAMRPKLKWNEIANKRNNIACLTIKLQQVSRASSTLLPLYIICQYFS